MPASISLGWEERIASKIAISASSGLLGGWAYAVLQCGPTKRWALATSASCAICAGTFAVLQEIVRATRQNAGPANSFIAGGLAAYGLSAIQFKCQQRAFAMGALCASTAAAADMALSALDVSSALRSALEGLDLIDSKPIPPEELPRVTVKREYTPEELQAASYQSMAYYKTGTWRDYLPVRKMSEEEWDLYQKRKASRFQEKIDQVTKPSSTT